MNRSIPELQQIPIQQRNRKRAPCHFQRCDIVSDQRTHYGDSRFVQQRAGRAVHQIQLHRRRTAETVYKQQRLTLSTGAKIADVHQAAAAYIRSKGYDKYFIHGTSHHIGLEVHDVGEMSRPLEPNMVITVEPGIYIPEEQLGVRIEDDVLVTASGFRVLSTFPKEIAEIEALAKR